MQAPLAVSHTSCSTTEPLPRVCPSGSRVRDREARDTLRTILDLAKVPALPDEVRRMVEYIEEYLFDPDLDFRGIIASARRPQLDTATIAECFAEHAGTPPMVFVETHRFEIAQRLLTRPDLTVAHAVRVAGFPSLAAFLRVAALPRLDEATKLERFDTDDSEENRTPLLPQPRVEAAFERLAAELSGVEMHALTAFLVGHFSSVERASS